MAKKNPVITKVEKHENIYTAHYKSGAKRNTTLEAMPKTIHDWLEANKPELLQEPVVTTIEENEPVETIVVQTTITEEPVNTDQSNNEPFITYIQEFEDVEVTCLIPTEEDIVDAEYRQLGLAESVYTTIWESLPSTGKTILDITTMTVGWVGIHALDLADAAYTLAMTTIIPEIRDYIIPDALYMVKKGLKWAAPKVRRHASKTFWNMMDSAVTMGKELKKLWMERDEMIREWKEVA